VRVAHEAADGHGQTAFAHGTHHELPEQTFRPKEPDSRRAHHCRFLRASRLDARHLTARRADAPPRNRKPGFAVGRWHHRVFTAKIKLIGALGEPLPWQPDFGSYAVRSKACS
jgi:hypothetical protein